MFALSVLFSFLLGLSVAQAQTCVDIFRVHLPSVAREVEPPTEIAQLFLWEQTANNAQWIMPTAAQALAVTLVPASQVQIRQISGNQSLVNFFNSGGKISWPQHPFNDNPTVPFYHQAPVVSYPVHFSASRSMFFWVDGQLHSVKMPTNHPHPGGFEQASKVDLTKSVFVSVERSEAIRNIDLTSGESPYLRVLYDVASFADKATGNGFVIRDLTPLQDGNFYLPGFSIPYVGLDIAQRHVARPTIESYWQVHYAEAVGRAKALLLLRYGLQMRTPNSQNWLVQLDKYMEPTGRIFMRDISDASLVTPIATALGLGALVARDVKNDVPVAELLRPETETTFFQMEHGGVFTDVQMRWETAHDKAYIRTILSELKVPNPKNYTAIHDVQNLLSSDHGITLLKNYAARLQKR